MQIPLEFSLSFPPAAYQYGARLSGGTHGVVLTKRPVVDLVLDLAGYDPDRPLQALRLLDPSCGHGAFLLPAVDRLVASTRGNHSFTKLADSICAYDIDIEHVQIARDACVRRLLEHGAGIGEAKDLSERWIRQGDFLLSSDREKFDFVVGNPPYIRIENLSPIVQAEYRRRFKSLFDRADLYVAFIEKGLGLLSARGKLSFVCADRWILNRYGGPLRQLITEHFGMRCYIDMHHAAPFDSSVVAYPAVFSIGQKAAGQVRVSKIDNASAAECERIGLAIANTEQLHPEVADYATWFDGDEPWILSSPEQMFALRNLESKHPALQEDGTRVGIGVATGNDKVYIVDDKQGIEPDRLVPLVMRDQIEAGRIRDAGRFVINTFAQDGKAIDLAKYPRLSEYFSTHEEAIRRRHVAKKNERAWFRTIDRVYPGLVSEPKLLIPDIAGANEVVLDTGLFHPHHNLYVITSKTWDLRVLGALLSSRVALFFVWSYAVKMRGGYLRFQAQYLRRIRVPRHGELSPRLASELASAFDKRDFNAIDELALQAYGIQKLPEFSFVDTRS